MGAFPPYNKKMKEEDTRRRKSGSAHFMVEKRACVKEMEVKRKVITPGRGKIRKKPSLKKTKPTGQNILKLKNYFEGTSLSTKGNFNLCQARHGILYNSSASVNR